MTPEARELYLFTISDGELYRSQGEPIVKNLARKKLKGIYREHLAAKLWTYLANNAAKKYTFEFDAHPGASSWHRVKGYGIFTVRQREETGKRLEQHYREQVDALARVLNAKTIKNPLRDFKAGTSRKVRNYPFYVVGFRSFAKKSTATRYARRTNQKVVTIRNAEQRERYLRDFDWRRH